MNLKKQPPAKKPARSSSRKRPLRKLFEPVSKPLETSVTPAATLRRPIRKSRTLWIMVALFCGLAVGVTQETNAPVAETNAPTPAGDVLSEAPDGVDAPEMTPDIAPEGNSNEITETNVQREPVIVVPAEQAAQVPQADDAAQPQPAVPATSVPPTTPSPSSRQAESHADAPARLAQPATQNRNQDRASRSVRNTQQAATSAQTADFSTFKILSERNIFNPNRSGRRGNNEPRPKPKTIESFGLVGLLSYEKGTFAFFDGTSSGYRKAAKEGDSIAGYHLAQVGDNSVKLSKGSQELELKVGSQLRREDQGEWSLSAAQQQLSGTSNSSSSGSSAPSAAPVSTGDANQDEVLKRLMQRRAQE